MLQVKSGCWGAATRLDEVSDLVDLTRMWGGGEDLSASHPTPHGGGRLRAGC